MTGHRNWINSAEPKPILGKNKMHKKKTLIEGNIQFHCILSRTKQQFDYRFSLFRACDFQMQ